MQRSSTGSTAEEEGDTLASGADVTVVTAPTTATTKDGFGDRLKLAELPIVKKDSSSTNTTTTASRPLRKFHPPPDLDRWEGESEGRPPKARSRRTSWKINDGRPENSGPAPPAVVNFSRKGAIAVSKMPESRIAGRYSRRQSPWTCSLLTLFTTILAISTLAAIINSFASRQLDAKGCRMSYMRPSFVKLSDFDTEHTRFASKYSLYLYREGMIDEDSKVKGIPVLFIPGNAGSYKQVRPIAAEGATYFHDVLRHDASAINAGAQKLDFFTVDFNEDITAFHGQTLLDQAEYLNEAIAFILSLYHDPQQSQRDSTLPDPTSVIILGHSMGGIVARAMLVMPNYQSNTINTIVTMSAPHARPPVSFDAEIVKTYKEINDYWRKAYSQKWANNNPLWHVTLISIAGGGLDTVVPSDYASLESLVPDTHGFTVFTSSVPNVWTGMDHQAILWCDQFRKVVVRSLYDIVDANRPSQTKPRADRMRIFKKWYLTGLETSAEKSLSQQEPTTLLTLEDDSNTIIAQGDRLILRKLGQSRGPRAYLMPIPPQGTPGGKRFTLLTDQRLGLPGASGNLEILFCSVFPPHPGQSTALFAMNLDLSDDSEAHGSTRLACRSAANDVIELPASTSTTKRPFYLDGEPILLPFSYLQYDLEDILEHQFVAVVDKAVNPAPGWVIAEFSDNVHSYHIQPIALHQFLGFGLRTILPANRPLVMEFKVSALQSSLLAYHLEMEAQECGEAPGLFRPLLRQYVSNPYESKFYVNVSQADISLHGVSPYMPPPVRQRDNGSGLSLQFWTDPTCNASIQISLKIDVFGSLGKLYMRYRTVFAAFPLLVVALVLRTQFWMYDRTGIFMPFVEGLDLCLRQSLPLVLAGLTILSVSLSRTSVTTPHHSNILWGWVNNGTNDHIDFAVNDLLIGSPDPFFGFMVPLIGFVCVGVCVMVNYMALSLTHISCVVYGYLSMKPAWFRNDEKKRPLSPAFAPPTPRRRILTTTILLFLVSTVIPYQFAYLVACLVQIATCTRALRFTRDTYSSANDNFYNYAHSILILMLWILPINLPILVVWVHNLAVHWLTPFSSHHNVLSIMPFILLVETLTSGKMVPRVTSRFRHLTSVSFFSLALYAAMYGVTYAYMLHYLVNCIAAWLVAIHFSASSWTIAGLKALFEADNIDNTRKEGKNP